MFELVGGMVLIRKTLASIFLMTVLLNGLLLTATACTIFSISVDEQVFVGNNEDWDHLNFSIRFYPEVGSRHGHVAFTHTEDIWDIRAGMNDHGVFIDSTWVRPSNVTIEPDKPYFDRNPFKYVLESCDSVNETIEKFSQYNLAETWDWQFLVADSSGDSVVIVAGPNETVSYIRKNGTFQLITNGNIALPGLGQSESSERRYNAALSSLIQIQDNLSISALRDTLDAAHSDWTAFSTVYDLVKRDFYIYYDHNYSSEIMFNLDAELEEGSHTYRLSELFNPYPGPVTNSDTITALLNYSLPFPISNIVIISIVVVFSGAMVILALRRRGTILCS